MRSHVDKQFIREVEKEFNDNYPFLKLEFPKNNAGKPDDPGYIADDETMLRSRAKKLLDDDVQLADGMKVSELETALQIIFNIPVQVMRKSGNFWIGTRMTRDWTLKQQNDQGRELI